MVIPLSVVVAHDAVNCVTHDCTALQAALGAAPGRQRIGAPSGAWWIICGWASRSNCGWRANGFGELSDPSGGLFDRAGDFDRLLRQRELRCPLFSTVDLHGETSFGGSAMPDLLAEIDILLDQARPGPERRGLMRLRMMAERCGNERSEGQLVFVGD